MGRGSRPQASGAPIDIDGSDDDEEEEEDEEEEQEDEEGEEVKIESGEKEDEEDEGTKRGGRGIDEVGENDGGRSGGWLRV